MNYARYMYGHAGYTGTIAEKDFFILIPESEYKDKYSPMEYANKLINEYDERVDDKWGRWRPKGK